MYSSYARRKTRITRGLRRKNQRPPRFALPLVPGVSRFNETDDNLSLSDDLSSGDELANEETDEALEHEIVMHANVYDFSLYWDRKQGSEASSGTEEERPSTTL
ncbi:hypothetical protein C6341_g24370 [Phytophthora cactorum]|nr:hypothetical protein C6341_g24370 [Phytophthora cactorum]